MAINKSDHREAYLKPELVKHANIKDLTFLTPGLVCSLVDEFGNPIPCP